MNDIIRHALMLAVDSMKKKKKNLEAQVDEVQIRIDEFEDELDEV